MGEAGDPSCQEKPLASHAPPVPQTDSGDQVENTKAIERTMVKELGKCPVTREKGGPDREPTSWGKREGPQRPGPSDCLLKTQVRAKL